MRPTSFPIAVALLAALTACGPDASHATSSPMASPSSGTPSSGGPATTTAPPTTSTSAEPSTAPDLPAGIPPLFEGDVGAANVPAAALVPLKTEVTGTWYGVSSEGEAIVVAWQVPGRDPLRLDRGYAVWRRFDDGGAPWRPVAAELLPRSAGVLGITGFPAELTGDGSDDVLLQLDTGGSGGCGRTLVLDLGAGQVVYDEEGCDRRVEPHAGPTGLLVTEAVYEVGDPHCCPSAFRETVLTYAGDGEWAVASERTTAA